MTSSLRNLVAKLTPSSSSSNIHRGPDGFTKAPKPNDLFKKTNAEEDGEECLHDCSSCTIKYPAKFSIDEDDKLYGVVNGWQRHLVVATGKTDWVGCTLEYFRMLLLSKTAMLIRAIVGPRCSR